MRRKLARVLAPLAVVAVAAAATVAVIAALPDGTTASGGASARPAATSPSAAALAPLSATLMSAAPDASGSVRVPALDGAGPSPAGSESQSSESATPQTTDSTAPPPGGSPTATTSLAAESPASSSQHAPGAASSTATRPAATQAAATQPAAASSQPPAAPRTTKPSATTSAARTSTAPKPAAPTTPKPTTTTPKPTAPNFGIPVALGTATQLITVQTASPSATRGTLRAWQKGSNGTWRVVYGPVTAWVGSAGIGTASESSSHTPRGTFTLTQAFGRLANPGTSLPYHQTVPNDWWVSDTRAASYNTMQTCAAAACRFNTKVSEHLYYVTPFYNYAVVMNVNRSPVVPGAGSAFFLHVSVGKPTAGCVAIDSSTLVSIMRWLKPAQHPRIATGIG